MTKSQLKALFNANFWLRKNSVRRKKGNRKGKGSAKRMRRTVWFMKQFCNTGKRTFLVSQEIPLFRLNAPFGVLFYFLP